MIETQYDLIILIDKEGAVLPVIISVILPSFQAIIGFIYSDIILEAYCSIAIVNFVASDYINDRYVLIMTQMEMESDIYSSTDVTDLEIQSFPTEEDSERDDEVGSSDPNPTSDAKTSKIILSIESIKAHQFCNGKLANGDIGVMVSGSFTTGCYTEFTAFDPLGELIACCCHEDILVYSSSEKADCVATLPHEDATWRCRFHPKAELLYSICSDGHIYEWNIKKWALQKRVKCSKMCLFGLDINLDKQILVVGSMDHSIYIYQLGTLEFICKLDGHKNSIEDVTLNNDGTLIASVSKDCTVRLWTMQNIMRGQVQMRLLGGHKHWVLSCMFSHCGTILATTSADHNIAVWDVEERKLLYILFGHSNLVWGCQFLSFSDGNNGIVSVSSDKTIRFVWLRLPYQLFIQNIN